MRAKQDPSKTDQNERENGLKSMSIGADCPMVCMEGGGDQRTPKMLIASRS